MFVSIKNSNTFVPLIEKQKKTIMKKRVLLLAALFAGTASFAQVTSLKNKKGWEILPQAGDYAISMDATPILNFGLNAVNVNTDLLFYAQHPGYVTGFNQVIVGKYFTSATTAYRAKVGINYITNNNDVLLGTTAGGTEYIRTDKTKTTNIQLGGGMEWRRGHNRLQGFYGAEALLMIGSPTATTKSEYNQDLRFAVDSLAAAPSRSLGVTSSSAFGFQARGFVGVEYFVLPKISLGAEFGWGIGFNSGSATVSTEIYNAGNNTTQTVETTAAGTSALTIGVDQASAALTATFHF